MSMNRIDSTSLPSQGALEAFRGAQRREEDTGKLDGATNAALPAGKPQGDSIEISDKAFQLMDLRATLEAGLEAVAAEPDMREERLAAVRERLSTGFHNAAAVQAKIAGGVGRVFKGIEEL